MSGAVESMDGILMGETAEKNLAPLDELVLTVRSGDTEAFGEIVALTEGRVLGLAWRLLGDKESARDASQEAYLRAFKSLSSYRIGDSFTSWIGRITANVCFDFMKKREGGEGDQQILDSVASSESCAAEASLLKQQQMELVQRALGSLSPAERSALVLRDMEGLSTNETAQRLGLKPATVRTQIAAARAKIKDFCQGISARSKGGCK